MEFTLHSTYTSRLSPGSFPWRVIEGRRQLMLLMLLLLLLLLLPLLLLAVRRIVRIRNHKMRATDRLFHLLLLAAHPPPPPPPLPPPPPRCPMHSQPQEPQDATARHHPTGQDLDLIIETKAEQIRTNAFFVLQLENVRQNLVCGRVAPVVSKPFTTVLFPPSILECSNTGVDKNLADRVLCFLKLQLLHIPCSKVGFGGSHGVSVGWGLLLSNASPTIRSRSLAGLIFPL
jgi:hypothetical protein